MSLIGGISKVRFFTARLSVAPTGSLNIFTSKEQEYEQKALLLKKLAFVIFCSEKDQYQKYMPEIQGKIHFQFKMNLILTSIIFRRTIIELLKTPTSHSLCPSCGSSLFPRFAVKDVPRPRHITLANDHR